MNLKCGVILEEQPNKDELRVRQATKQGYIVVKKGGLFDSAYPNSEVRRGRVQGDGGSYSPTLTCAGANGILHFEGYNGDDPIVRRLTPKECFRLMGVADRDIEKIQGTGISTGAQYKLAGNSIVEGCLYEIFKELLTGSERKKYVSPFDLL